MSTGHAAFDDENSRMQMSNVVELQYLLNMSGGIIAVNC